MEPHILLCVLLGDLGYCLQFVFVLNKATETQSNSFWQGNSFSSRISLPWDWTVFSSWKVYVFVSFYTYCVP